MPLKTAARRRCSSEGLSEDDDAALLTLAPQARMEQAVRTLLTCLGEDPAREGLLDTPKRVAKAMLDTSSGYHQTPAGVLGTAFFHEPIVHGGGNGLVLVRDIDFASTSEETLLPFHGRAHIGYVPRGGVVLGLSKLARLTRVFAKRLQSQERLGLDLCAALGRHLRCQGVAVVLQATHLSMGHHPQQQQEGQQQEAPRTTACVSGRFADPAASSFHELLAMLGVADELAPGALHTLPSREEEEGAAAGALQHLRGPEHQQVGSSVSSASSSCAPRPPPTPDLSSEHLSELDARSTLSSGGGSAGGSATTPSCSDRDEDDVEEEPGHCLVCKRRQHHGREHQPALPPPAAAPQQQEQGGSPGTPGTPSRGHGTGSVSGASVAAAAGSTEGGVVRPRTAEALDQMERAVRTLLRCVGEDPDRQSLTGSARRYASTLLAATAGYARALPAPLPLRAAPTPQQQQQQQQGEAAAAAAAGQEAVVPRAQAQALRHVVVPFTSQCEHHMLPFYGHAHVVYARPSSLPSSSSASAAAPSHPQQQRLGSSSSGSGPAPSGQQQQERQERESEEERQQQQEAEVVRQVVGVFTQRLQVQERITHQVADAAARLLGVEDAEEGGGVLVLLEASHMCMVARGVENHAGRTASVAARGAAAGDAAWRARALALCRAARV